MSAQPAPAAPAALATRAPRQRGWMGVLGVVAVLATLAGLAAWHTLPLAPAATGQGALAGKAEQTFDDGPLPAALQTFVLAALLVPLLDEASPPRWTDVAIDHFCAPGTRVWVNGQPMPVGEPIPSQPFTVQWWMSLCQPLGPSAVALSGRVELQVFHDGDALSAIVTPQHVGVDNAHGRMWWNTALSASTSLATATWPDAADVLLP